MLAHKGEKNKMTIKIPKTTIIHGNPVAGAIDRVLSKSQNAPQQTAQPRVQNREGMIYIHSAGVYVAKQRTHLNEDWFQAHKSLASGGLRMPTIPEFIAYLKYLKEDPTNQEFQEIYNEITQVREPWRAEWLDADFKLVNGVLNINYNHTIQNGKLIPRNSEPLDGNTLMENRTPGISLEDWLKFPTSQGFPRKDIVKGDLYYWAPMSDNNSVARFDAVSDGAYLNCGRDPSGRDSDLGVFAVAEPKGNARP